MTITSIEIATRDLSKLIDLAKAKEKHLPTPVYNVAGYGAKGDGTIDDSGKINDAVNAASAKGGTVVFPPGTYRIASNLTIPSNVTLWFMNGAKLSIDAGVTVTINGPIDAGLHQIFSGSGNVETSSSVVVFFPEWWGAVRDGVTDCYTAITKSIFSASTGGKWIHFSPGYYKISNTIQTVVHGMRFTGSGMSITNIVPNGSFHAFLLTHSDIEIEEMVFFPNVVQTAGAGIKIENSSGNKLRRLTFATYDGIDWDRGSNGFISDIVISNINGIGINLHSTVAGSPIVDIFIENVTAGGSGTSLYGLRIGSECSGIYASKCNFLTFNKGIFIDNSTAGANAPKYIFLDTCLGDGSRDVGIHINSGQDIYLDECWGASSTNYGFLIDGDASNVWLRGCTSANNGQHGILINTSGTNNNGVHLRDCDVWGNSVSLVNGYHGIVVISNINNFSIIGCKSGQGPSLTDNQGYGIIINSGTSNNYIVANNILVGNNIAGLSDGGTGTNKIVTGNITV